MSAILAFHLWMTFKTNRQNKEVWTLALFAVVFGFSTITSRSISGVLSAKMKC
jgi:hypothetical protein